MERAEAWRPLRSPLPWYGGKNALALRIAALLPPHDVYLEPFAGGLSVFFAKPPAPLETINDINEGIVGFYRVLRDPVQCTEFQRLCTLTPYARAEFERCRQTWESTVDPVQRAWAWFVMVRQGFGSREKHASWGFRRGNEQLSAGTRWANSIDGLAAVHTRLRRVQVDCADWRRLLTTYDGPGVLLYADPPYVLATRSGGKRYLHEMDVADHTELTQRLLAWQGMALLSGYRHDVIHAPLEEAGWQRLDWEVTVSVARTDTGKRRTESVWSNPAAVAARSQPSLFSSEEVPRG